VEPVLLDVPARVAPGPSADPATAGRAVTAFGWDLLAAVTATSATADDVVVSPASVAVVLAMVEPGAVGEARSQLRRLLRVDDLGDPAAYHASMNALGRDLEARAVPTSGASDRPGEITVRLADAAYLQHDVAFERTYLDAIGRAYGPVLHAVDFAADPDAVAHEINRFVAEATEGRIVDPLPDGALTAATVLTLVNALYLHASWLAVFAEGATADAPFTRLDGTRVTVPLMHGTGDASAAGDGWVAAAKAYVGGLACEFVLPDEGRFDEVASSLPAVVAALDGDDLGGGELALPRFETRFSTELSQALRSLGLTAPFGPGALTGIADDPRIVLDQAFHETYLAMDEHGTEAAAATILTFRKLSAPARSPVAVILDRPFIFRILDRQTGVTLFVGRVLDPTA
jgi:serpin B